MTRMLCYWPGQTHGHWFTGCYAIGQGRLMATGSQDAMPLARGDSWPLIHRMLCYWPGETHGHWSTGCYAIGQGILMATGPQDDKLLARADPWPLMATDPQDAGLLARVEGGGRPYSFNAKISLN